MGTTKYSIWNLNLTGLSYLTRLTVDTKICALDDGLIEMIKTKKEKKSILKKWTEPLRIVEQYQNV